GPMSRDASDGRARGLVLNRLHEWYGIEPQQVAENRPLAELGLTSRDAVALAAELSAAIGIPLPATLLWDAPTLAQIEQRVREELASSVAAPIRMRAPASHDPVPAERRGTSRTAEQVEIAVVGIGCRLPDGIRSADEFWQALLNRTDAISTLPPGRWDGFAHPDDPALAQIPRHGGFLDDVAGFDAAFFGIAPSEAAAMDPQQRLLLEVARESLDHAAIPAGSLAGSRTGVFVGISGNEYARLTTAALDAVEAWSAPGAALSIAANRLSYALDLRG